MVDATYKHIIEDEKGYIVFPRYFTEEQTKRMREDHDRLFNGGECVQRPDYGGAGVGTLWAAEAYSPAIDAFSRDESLRAAAITVMNHSARGRALLEDGFVEVTSTAFYQNMASCGYANDATSPLCGIVSVSPASRAAPDSRLDSTPRLRRSGVPGATLDSDAAAPARIVRGRRRRVAAATPPRRRCDATATPRQRDDAAAIRPRRRRDAAAASIIDAGRATTPIISTTASRPCCI